MMTYHISKYLWILLIFLVWHDVLGPNCVDTPNSHTIDVFLQNHNLSCDYTKISKLDDQYIYSICENTVAKKMLYCWLFYDESHHTKDFILLYLQCFFTTLKFLTCINLFILIFEFKAARNTLALIIVQGLAKREPL